MRKILVSILLLLSSITLPAQSPQVGWETLYAQLLEQDDETGQAHPINQGENSLIL